jgi:hypothetical protein
LLTLVAGREIYRNDQVTSVDEESLRDRLDLLSRKLDT